MKITGNTKEDAKRIVCLVLENSSNGNSLNFREIMERMRKTADLETSYTLTLLNKLQGQKVVEIDPNGRASINVDQALGKQYLTREEVTLLGSGTDYGFKK